MSPASSSHASSVRTVTPRVRLRSKCSLTPDKKDELEEKDCKNSYTVNKHGDDIFEPIKIVQPLPDCQIVAKVRKSEPGRVGVQELRAALPSIWRHFSGRTKGAARRRSQVIVRIAAVRKYLQRSTNPASRWGSASEDKLATMLRAVAGTPQLRQRMGFRFQDPSFNGSWAASNLVGYRESPMAPSKRNFAEMSWDTYVAGFRLRMGGGAVAIERSLVRKPVVARVEKRRRGDPGGPLAREPMYITAASRRKVAGDRRKRIRVERRTCDLLPAVLFRSPSGPQQWTMIYLHGLGSSALASYADRPHYFFDGSVALKVVIPTAPSREVSCYDGWWIKGKNKWRLTKFLSWYDYLSNYDGAREDAIDWESLGAVQRALHAVIRNEAMELGGRSHRVILGGKSQGCCTALDSLLTYPEPLGGFVGVVGHLLSCTPVERRGPQCRTPIHFFHEPEDKIMRWPWVRKSEQRLREAGYNVRSRRVSDPENHGHFVEGVEGAWIRNALRSICCSNASSS